MLSRGDTAAPPGNRRLTAESDPLTLDHCRPSGKRKKWWRKSADFSVNSSRRCSRKSRKMMQKFIRFSQNDAESHQIFTKKPSKIDQNGDQERRRNDTGSKSVTRAAKGTPRGPKGYPPQMLFSTLWPPLGRFGCHFGAQRVPRGDPKSPFFTQNRQKSRKSGAREASVEIYTFW